MRNIKTKVNLSALKFIGNNGNKSSNLGTKIGNLGLENDNKSNEKEKQR